MTVSRQEAGRRRLLQQRCSSTRACGGCHAGCCAAQTATTVGGRPRLPPPTPLQCMAQPAPHTHGVSGFLSTLVSVADTGNWAATSSTLHTGGRASVQGGEGSAGTMARPHKQVCPAGEPEGAAPPARANAHVAALHVCLLACTLRHPDTADPPAPPAPSLLHLHRLPSSAALPTWQCTPPGRPP